MQDNSQNIHNIQWSHTGLLYGLEKGNQRIAYAYNPMGFRIKEHTGKCTSYTVYDAHSQPVAQYQLHNDSLRLLSHTLYGSSRLGVYLQNKVTGVLESQNFVSLPLQEMQRPLSPLTLSPTPINRFNARRPLGRYYTLELGNKQYELTNHLGNVQAVVSDRKLPVLKNGFIAKYQADLLQTQYYYPYGSTLFSHSLKAYPFGYNTQVKDTNIANDVYHARFWEYDAKVALRWNVDPKPNTSISSYSVFAANPIWFSDVMGDTVIYALDQNAAGGQGHMSTLIQDKDSRWYFFSQYAKEPYDNIKLYTNQDIEGGIDLIAFPKISYSTSVIRNGKTIEIQEERNMNGKEAVKYLKTFTGYSADKIATLYTSKQQDNTIFNNALEKVSNFNNKKEYYSLFSNNCVDGGQDITQKNTGINLPIDFNPSPNDYFPILTTGVNAINSKIYQNYNQRTTPIDATYVKPPIEPIK